MFNFIAHISFNYLKHKSCQSLFADHLNGSKIENTSYYRDDVVNLKFIGSNQNLYLFNEWKEKYLVFGSICEDDRELLKDKLHSVGVNGDSDSEMMLKLFLQFGLKGFKCLPSGFTFIFIDYKKEKALAARDHIGMKSLYYCKYDDSIYISSLFKELSSLDFLNFHLNIDKVTNFLNFSDFSKTDTFVEEINKVPPLHVLNLNNTKVSINRYSKYTLKARFGSTSDQIQGLRKLLTEIMVIDKRGYHKKIGFLFSGGLDSSTIISFFRHFKNSNQRIFTLSAQFKNLNKDIIHLIDESNFQREITDLDGIESIEFDGQAETTLSNIDFYLDIIGQPFFFPNLYLSNRAFYLAANHGIKTVVNGNDGDTVISHGYEFLRELFYTFQWLKLYREIKVTSKVRCQKKWFVFRRIILSQFTLKGFWSSSAQQDHLRILSTSNHSKALEIQGTLASYYGIDERYPFYNRTLIEYCLNVSPRLKNKNGFSRFILKEAVAGVVPEKIRNRTTKSNLAHALCVNFVEKDHALIEYHLENPNFIITKSINIDFYRDSWNKLKRNPRKFATRSSFPSKLFSYVVLNRWLETSSKKYILPKNTLDF